MVRWTCPAARPAACIGYFLAGQHAVSCWLSARRQLPHLSLHRVRAVLRPGLPHGDEAGTGHLPARPARARRLRANVTSARARNGSSKPKSPAPTRSMPWRSTNIRGPIPTPIKNLRPAQETCEQCHWPKKFVGNLDRTYNYFLGDETNTPFSVRLTMKVGGGDPTHGPVGGIHWHMNVGNKVQYVATDDGAAEDSLGARDGFAGRGHGIPRPKFHQRRRRKRRSARWIAWTATTARRTPTSRRTTP